MEFSNTSIRDYEILLIESTLIDFRISKSVLVPETYLYYLHIHLTYFHWRLVVSHIVVGPHCKNYLSLTKCIFIDELSVAGFHYMALRKR